MLDEMRNSNASSYSPSANNPNNSLGQYDGSLAGNENHFWNGNRMSVDDAGLNLSSETPQKFIRRSADDMFAGDARMHRIANAEAAMRQEIFKECTFRPQIKNLPPKLYGAMKNEDSNFHNRVSKWQRERDLEVQTKSRQIESGELQECTFQPKINHNSDKAVKVLRGESDNPVDTSKRLYKNFEVAHQQRVHLINTMRAKEDAMNRETCTFQPQLLTKNTPVYQNVHSKFTQVNQPKPSQALPSDLKNCTFTPKVSRYQSATLSLLS